MKQYRKEDWNKSIFKCSRTVETGYLFTLEYWGSEIVGVLAEHKWSPAVSLRFEWDEFCRCEDSKQPGWKFKLKFVIKVNWYKVILWEVFLLKYHFNLCQRLYWQRVYQWIIVKLNLIFVYTMYIIHAANFRPKLIYKFSWISTFLSIYTGYGYENKDQIIFIACL